MGAASEREPSPVELMVDLIISLDGYASGEGWPGWWGLEGPEYLAWLDQERSAPFFLFLHYWDPHTPYLPPPPYDRMFDKPAAGRPLTEVEYKTQPPDIRKPRRFRDLDIESFSVPHDAQDPVGRQARVDERLELGGHLADRRRLAGAVDADHEDDAGGSALAADLQRPVHRRVDEVDELLAEHGLRLGGAAALDDGGEVEHRQGRQGGSGRHRAIMPPTLLAGAGRRYRHTSG